MSILLTLTTDGTDREDGNVWYAVQLLIDAPESARSSIIDFLTNHFAGRQEGGDRNRVLFDAFANADKDAAFESDALAELLTQTGWPTKAVKPVFLIQNRPG